MSFENYAALQAEIKSFLWDRSDVTDRIPSFIQLAETEARRLLRTRQVVHQDPFTVTYEIGSIPCHAREVLTIKLENPENILDGDLTYMGPEEIDQYTRISPARPRFYTIIGDEIRFLPTPDQTYTGHIRYREGICALSNHNPTNWLLKTHPDIYLAGALKWAKMWLIDADQDWATPFYQAIEIANKDQPMRQRNTLLRNNEMATLGRRNGYNVRTDTY